MILERFKPASSSRARLMLAAAVWTVVGTGLFVAGTGWLRSGGGPWGWSLAAAMLVGWLKGYYLLAPRAAANARRIAAAGDGRCVGGVFSRGTWLLVVGMIALGAVLRRTTLPSPWSGWLYAAVGTALLWGALQAWSYWRRAAPRRAPPTA